LIRKGEIEGSYPQEIHKRRTVPSSPLSWKGKPELQKSKRYRGTGEKKLGGVCVVMGGYFSPGVTGLQGWIVGNNIRANRNPGGAH